MDAVAAMILINEFDGTVIIAKVKLAITITITQCYSDFKVIILSNAIRIDEE